VISWAEWKQWTQEGEDDLLDERMSECLNSPQVRQFLSAFSDWLTYSRVCETSRHLEDPNRKMRTYSEALREVSQKLIDIKNLHEGKHDVRSISGGIRRR
jgi:hypothetical protein